jgi:hypothetical protein
LEADVESFAYLLPVTKLGEMHRASVGTRMVGGRENAEYDIAIGRVVSTKDLNTRSIPAADL